MSLFFKKVFYSKLKFKRKEIIIIIIITIIIIIVIMIIVIIIIIIIIIAKMKNEACAQDTLNRSVCVGHLRVVFTWLFFSSLLLLELIH